MIRNMALVFLASLLLGCGSQESITSFIGLGDSPDHFRQRFGKETRKNKPSILHASFSLDAYHDANGYRYRASYMGDSAELVTILKQDGSAFLDAELEMILAEFSSGKQWHHRGTLPDGGQMWQRDDAAVAKYSEGGKAPALELMTTKTLKLFTVNPKR